MRKLSKFIAIFSGVISCIFLVINIADILTGVIARQYSASVTWTEELARISLVWCVMLGASAAFYEGDNMTVDFMLKLFPERIKKFCGILSFMIESTVLIVLIYYGYLNVMGGWTMKTMALHIPRAIPLMSVPAGMSLFLTVLIMMFFERKCTE